MKIYVACSSREIPRARAVMADLRAAGHEITHDWTHHVEQALASGQSESMLDDDFCEEAAHSDLDGVHRADVLVFLAPTETAKGAWIEFGYAMGLCDMPIVVAHDDEARRKQSIFTRLVGAHCDDAGIVEAALRLAGAR